MENPSSNGRSAVEQELIKGHNMANQLLLEVLSLKSNGHYRDGFAEDLIRNILRSFTNTLLLLTTNNDVYDKEVVPVTIKNLTSSAIHPKSEDSNEACKLIDTKNRRGCSKRKLTTPTWQIDNSILTEDGYAWRKYGHKMIINAKYPRSYYRCSHKRDQGCPAMKKVQRIQEDPPLYRTKYQGHHICTSSLTNPNMNYLEPSSCLDSSMFLSFNINNNLPCKEEHPFSSTLVASEKQEPMEEIPNDNVPQSSQLASSDYLLCDYELDFDYGGHIAMLSSSKSVQFDNIYGDGLNFDR